MGQLSAVMTLKAKQTFNCKLIIVERHLRNAYWEKMRGRKMATVTIFIVR